MHLVGTYKILAGLLMGIICGFVLVKSDLVWRKSTADILTLKDGRLIKTILLFIGFGTFLFFFLRRSGVVEVKVFPAFLWTSVAGGAISGIGLFLCGFTAFTAFVALGCGRIYTLWTILGMFLALPFVDVFNQFLSQSVYKWGSNASLQVAEPYHFFALDNPAIWIIFISCILIFLVQFAIGDNSE